MPLNKSSNKTIHQSLIKYITDGEVFLSSLTTGTNKWCLGIKNEGAAPWCKGKYNVVIVAQHIEDELLAIQKKFQQYKLC